jgi:hypothetical protein
MAEEEQTCGKGLAENSALPTKLGELEAALTAVLEAHMKALDVSDENSRAERDAYERIARGHREAAARLEATAREMAGQRDLPMGRHNMEALASGEQMAAFEGYVRVKRGLLALLQETMAEDEKMLREMGTTPKLGDSGE